MDFSYLFFCMIMNRQKIFFQSSDTEDGVKKLTSQQPPKIALDSKVRDCKNNEKQTDTKTDHIKEKGFDGLPQSIDDAA